MLFAFLVLECLFGPILQAWLRVLGGFIRGPVNTGCLRPSDTDALPPRLL